MATCKDCINYAACKVAKLNNDDYVERWCNLFKDRAKFIELPTPINVSERFEKCSLELINIAKCADAPSKILRIIGENFTELANRFEAEEHKVEQALKERDPNGQSQN